MMTDQLKAMLEDVLSRYPEIQLCIVFGSAATGRLTAESDLDIALAADRPLGAESRLELLEELSAHTGRAIDLVDLSAASGPVVRQALCRGVIVQNRNKTLYARLISRMLFDQSDWMPYYDRILRVRRERFLNG
jgi:predicted nucleotidyltransferase